MKLLNESRYKSEYSYFYKTKITYSPTNFTKFKITNSPKTCYFTNFTNLPRTMRLKAVMARVLVCGRMFELTF